MAVHILSKRKIARHRGESADSFSNDKYSIPNFRIAKCDFWDDQQTPEAAKKKEDDTRRNILRYTLLPESEKQRDQEVREIYG